jgi:hypothetical protein
MSALRSVLSKERYLKLLTIYLFVMCSVQVLDISPIPSVCESTFGTLIDF